MNANPLPYNHVPCPTCVDCDIVESEVAGCGNCIFCECCDFACPECQCRWDEMEELVEQYMEADLVQLRLDEDVITPGQGRNLIYKLRIILHTNKEWQIYKRTLSKNVKEKDQ